jgi:hypothetical protein
MLEEAIFLLDPNIALNEKSIFLNESNVFAPEYIYEKMSKNQQQKTKQIKKTESSDHLSADIIEQINVGIINHEFFNISLSYSNDCHWYIFSELTPLLILAKSYKKIIIIHRQKKSSFNRHLIKTIEFPKGSFNLFLSTQVFLIKTFLNPKIEEVILDAKTRTTKEYLIENSFFRKMLCYLSGLQLIVKYKRPKSIVPTQKIDGNKNIAIIRSIKHLETTRKNKNNFNLSGIIYFPQLMTQNFSINERNLYIISPSKVSLMIYFIKSIKCNIFKKKHSNLITIKVLNSYVDFDLKYYLSELTSYTPIVMYFFI